MGVLVTDLRSRLLPLVLLLLFVLPYFLNLSGPSLWDSTEAFYAETPREMIERGNFIVPYFNDGPRLNKPPLSYWLVLPFYRIFGVSVVAERLPNALGAGLIVMVTFLLGRRMFGWREGLWAAAVIATTPRLVQIAQKSIIDTYLTHFVLGALFLFYLWQATAQRSALVLFYLVVGLGALTKGPIALVLSGGGVLCYLLITRQWLLLHRLNIPLGVLIVAAVVLPYYVALYLERGWGPIAAFIVRENVGRFSSDIDWSSRDPFYYFPALLGDFFPWSLLLVPAGIYAYRTIREREVLLLVVWTVFIFVFFSLAQNKHEYYLVPLYPAAAVLMGRFFTRLADDIATQAERRAAQIMTVLISVGLLSGSVVLALFMKHVLMAPAPSYVFPSLLFIGGLWLAAHVRGLTLKRMPLMAAGVMMAAVVGYQAVYLPLIEPFRPTKPLCQVMEAHAGPADQVGYYKFAAPSMTFYLRRKIFEVYQPEIMVDLLKSDRRVFCILPESDLPEIKQQYAGPLVVLERRPALTFRLRPLLSSDPQTALPQVVLITNRATRAHPF